MPTSTMGGEAVLAVGDLVEKVTGEYRFLGEVRAVFVKKSGAFRYVVENGDGLLHIFSARDLRVLGAAPLADRS